jgi:hypothetical protein
MGAVIGLADYLCGNIMKFITCRPLGFNRFLGAAGQKAVYGSPDLRYGAGAIVFGVLYLVFGVWVSGCLV